MAAKKRKSSKPAPKRATKSQAKATQSVVDKLRESQGKVKVAVQHPPPPPQVPTNTDNKKVSNKDKLETVIRESPYLAKHFRVLLHNEYQEHPKIPFDKNKLDALLFCSHCTKSTHLAYIATNYVPDLKLHLRTKLRQRRTRRSVRALQIAPRSLTNHEQRKSHSCAPLRA